MRWIAEFDASEDARGLADFMEVQGIEVEVRDGKMASVWVLDDDLQERANEALAAYDGESRGAYAAAAAKVRLDKQRKAKPVPPQKSQSVGTSSGDAPIGMLTAGLIAASVLVAVLTKIGAEQNAILLQLYVIPIEVDGDWIRYLKEINWEQPWRLLTPMFIHFGIFHIVFNMMWLFRFGNQIESVHGTLGLLLVVCVAQVAASMAQFYISGPLFGGMSGVNYGLFGFVWMHSKYGKGYGIDNRDTLLLMGWMVLCATGAIGPIANAAHAMGLAMGLLAGLPVYLRHRQQYETKRAIEKGSWSDLNLVGWQRFERQFVQPYVPLWFMGIALGILLLDLL